MNIYTQLYEAKKEIGAIAKNSKNPFFKSKYFDINKILEVIEPILQRHEILLLQPLKDGIVTTRLVTKDGKDSIESSMELPKLNDPQKIGSAITYFRRYTLQSLLGLQAEDDDTNLANKPAPPVKKQLDEVGFAYLISDKATKEQITEALEKRRMSDSQRATLISIKNK